MATVPGPNQLQLPVASALAGDESIWIVQGGVDKRTTVGDAAAFPETGATFVTATNQGAAFTSSRQLAAETSVTTVTDNGAASTIVVGIAAHGVANAKLAQMAALTVKSNLTNALADAADNSIAALLGGIYTPSIVSAAGAAAIGASDLFVIINKTDGADVVLPALASKTGPVLIVAAQGSAHAFNVTLTDGTIMGALTTFPFNGDYQAATFYPVGAPLNTWVVT